VGDCLKVFQFNVAGLIGSGEARIDSCLGGGPTEDPDGNPMPQLGFVSHFRL